MSELAERIIHLNGQGKHFGRLEITDGRLLLEVKRGQRHLRFDLLASVKTGQAVYEDVAEGDRQKITPVLRSL